MRRQRQHVASGHLNFRPLEDQNPLRFQYAEALGKAGAQVLAPITAELPVLPSEPALRAGADQVRRIECDEGERSVRERERTEVHARIRANRKRTGPVSAMRSVCDDNSFVSLVAE